MTQQKRAIDPAPRTEIRTWATWDGWCESAKGLMTFSPQTTPTLFPGLLYLPSTAELKTYNGPPQHPMVDFLTGVIWNGWREDQFVDYRWVNPLSGAEISVSRATYVRVIYHGVSSPSYAAPVGTSVDPWLVLVLETTRPSDRRDVEHFDASPAERKLIDRWQEFHMGRGNIAA
jgi:hypothetical protein